MLFVPQEKLGRTGLYEIDVTPVLYLHLLDQLEQGKEVPFRKAQLDLALADFLRNNNGAWKKEQARDLKNLEKFALDYVAAQREKLRDRQKYSKEPFSAQQKKALSMMEKLGVAPVKTQDLPENLQGGKVSPGEKTAQNVNRTEMAVNIAETLIEVATYAEPGVASAAVVIAASLTPSVCMQGSRILFDKLTKRADTPEEEKVCVSGLREVMGPPEKHALAEEAAEAQNIVKNPQAREEIRALRPVAPKDDRAELARSAIAQGTGEVTLISTRELNRDHVPVRLGVFRQNMDLAAKPVFAAPLLKAETSHPNFIKTAPDWKSGPKPPGWAAKDDKV